MERQLEAGAVVMVGDDVNDAALAVSGAINPLIAAIMMPVSSLTVTLLAWRSTTFRTEP